MARYLQDQHDLEWSREELSHCVNRPRGPLSPTPNTRSGSDPLNGFQIYDPSALAFHAGGVHMGAVGSSDVVDGILSVFYIFGRNGGCRECPGDV